MNDFNGLFLGDSHPNIVLEGINNHFDDDKPIKFDLVKLSHHGSKNNISNDLLNRIECFKYIISTNGGKGISKHPDRQTIAKIVSHPNMSKKKVHFYFNYPLIEIEKHTGRLFKEEELALFSLSHKNKLTK